VRTSYIRIKVLRTAKAGSREGVISESASEVVLILIYTLIKYFDFINYHNKYKMKATSKNHTSTQYYEMNIRMGPDEIPKDNSC
jgi:hypothetical protein